MYSIFYHQNKFQLKLNLHVLLLLVLQLRTLTELFSGAPTLISFHLTFWISQTLCNNDISFGFYIRLSL